MNIEEMNTNKCYVACLPEHEEGEVIGYFYAPSEEEARVLVEAEVFSEEARIDIALYRCEGLDNMQGKFSYGKNPHFVDILDKGNIKVLKELGYILERKDGDYTCYHKKEDCEFYKQIMIEDEDEDE